MLPSSTLPLHIPEMLEAIQLVLVLNTLPMSYMCLSVNIFKAMIGFIKIEMSNLWSVKKSNQSNIRSRKQKSQYFILKIKRKYKHNFYWCFIRIFNKFFLTYFCWVKKCKIILITIKGPLHYIKTLVLFIFSFLE